MQGHPGERARAIIIDDNDASRTFIALMLKRVHEGIVVDEFAGSKAAICEIRKFSMCSDLVIIDHEEGVNDGVAVVRALREIEGYASVPIILLAARMSNTSRIMAFEAGATDVIARPIPPDELPARCRNYLQLRLGNRKDGQGG